MNKTITAIQNVIISGLLFLYPLIFLPFTQEYFLTTKWYLLAGGSLLLLLISGIKLLTTKKITLQIAPLDWLMVGVLFIMGISTFFSAPNPVQSLLHLTNGFILWLSLFILYIHCKSSKIKPFQALFYGSFIASIVYLIFSYLQPFMHSQLPPYFQMLKTPHFSTLGNQLEATVMFSLIALISWASLILAFAKKSMRHHLNWIHVFMSVVILAGALQSLAILVAQPITTPSLSQAWLTGLESLKTLKTMLLGFGPDNYATAFISAKTPLYNASVYWNQTFRASSSAILQLVTEIGVLGTFLFCGYILAESIKAVRSTRLHIFSSDHGTAHEQEQLLQRVSYTVGFISVGIILVLTPMTQAILVVLFVILAELSINKDSHESSLKFTPPLPLILIISLLFIISSLCGAYYLNRAYKGEYYFKQALDNLRSAPKVYDYHKKAIRQNPFIERFRISFSQLNLLLADSIAKKKTITDKDKQTITQAIQASISESKAAVKLNPQKTASWINLANIYRNLIRVAKGSDTWTISAYGRATLLDPYNPILRFNLGSVYYGLGSYDKAVSSFRQAIELKPSIANFHYNLAWTQYKLGQYDDAVKSMSNVLTLIKDKKSDDYKKAEKEMRDFQKTAKDKKVSKTPEQPVSNGQTTGQLILPKAEPTLSPKIDLPQDAGIATDSAQ
ncbi:MAG: tetratricopeptide repeat protein [Candidatus Roizmanbacteria bacterium]